MHSWRIYMTIGNSLVPKMIILSQGDVRNGTANQNYNNEELVLFNLTTVYRYLW